MAKFGGFANVLYLTSASYNLKSPSEILWVMTVTRILIVTLLGNVGKSDGVVLPACDEGYPEHTGHGHTVGVSQHVTQAWAI